MGILSLTRKFHFGQLSPAHFVVGLSYHRFILTGKYHFWQAGTQYISEHFARYPLRRVVRASSLLSTSEYPPQLSGAGPIVITSVGRHVAFLFTLFLVDCFVVLLIKTHMTFAICLLIWQFGNFDEKGDTSGFPLHF
jgi:hypothetical protein